GGLGERLLGAALADRAAKVDEAYMAVDQAGIEEREMLHVADELYRGLGERGEIKALFALAGEVKEELQREDGLARSGRAGDHVDGSRGEPSTEDTIKGGAAGRQARERGDGAFQAQGCYSSAARSPRR